MSARQNPHARRNSAFSLSDPAIRRGITVDPLAVDNVAVDWIRTANPRLPPSELVNALYAALQARTPQTRLAIAQRCWESNDPRLCLSAAFCCLAGVTFPNMPARKDLREFFFRTLLEQTDPQLTELAACGLAWLYIYREEVLKQTEALELELLLLCLDDPVRRHAVLAAFRLVREENESEYWLNTPRLQESIISLLTDPNTSPSEQRAALDVADVFENYASQHTPHVLRLLANPRTEEKDVESLLWKLNWFESMESLVGMVRSSDVALARRQQIVQLLSAARVEYVRWNEWKALVTDPGVESEVKLSVIRMFANFPDGSHLSDFLAFARRADLPADCQTAVFRALWEKAPKIERLVGADPDVLEVLLALGRNPEVSDHVLGGQPLDAYRGRVSDGLHERIRGQLGDTALPLSYRYLLSRVLRRQEDLRTDEFLQIADVWIQVAQSDALECHRQGQNAIWEDLAGFGMSNREVARRYCEDERVPFFVRLRFLRRVPRWTIFRVVRSQPLTDNDRAKFWDALESHLPDQFASSCNVLRRSDRYRELETELLETAAFWSDDPRELVLVSADPTKGALVRWLANEWFCEAKLPVSEALFSEGTSTVANIPLSALALAAASASSGSDSGPVRDLLVRRVSQGTASPLDQAYLVSFLLRHSEETLAALCGRPEIPLGLRRKMIQQVAQETASCREVEDRLRPSLTWNAWRDVVLHVSEADLGEDLVGLFTRNVVGEHWDDLIQLARRPDLPVAVQQALFIRLWGAAKAIERQAPASGPLLPILLEMGSRLDLGALFPEDSALPYFGKIGSDGIARVLAVLRDGKQSLLGRILLAECVPFDARLSSQDRHLLVGALLGDERDRASFTVTNSERLRRLLVEHATRDRQLAHQLILDDRTPDVVREHLVVHADRTTILQYIRHIRSANPQARLGISVLGALKRFAVLGSGEQFRQDIYQCGPYWQEILATPEFFTDDFPALVSRALNPLTSARARALAMEWAFRDAGDRADGAMYLLRGSIAAFFRDDLSPGEVSPLARYIQRIASVHRHNASVVALLIDTCLNRDLPLARRLRLLQSIPDQVIWDYDTTFWDALVGTPEPWFRAGILQRFARANYLVLPPEMGDLSFDSVQPEASPPKICDSEGSEWKTISRLGVLLRADAPALLRIARDPDEPAMIRKNASHWLTTRPAVFAGSSRGLWAYLATPEGRSFWEDPSIDPEVREKVREELVLPVGDTSLRYEVRLGPRSVMWDAIVQIGLLPDQGLAGQAFLELQAPSLTAWASWQERLTGNVPLSVQLATTIRGYYSPHGESFARSLNQAFALARGSHSKTAELTDALIRSMVAPEAACARSIEVFTQCKLDAVDTPEERARAIDSLIRVLRLAPIEAQMLALEGGGRGDDFDHWPDLSAENYRKLVQISTPAAPDVVATLLLDATATRLQAHLPTVPLASIARVLAQTIAPALLAAHYRNVHPQGIPLLGQAMQAYVEGDSSWRAWRYDRPQARRQLPQLSPEQVALWHQNLTMSVEVETLPSDVREAARRIRERIQRAVRGRDVPEELRSLLSDVLAERRSPAEQIRGYEAIKKTIGSRLGNQKVDLLPEQLGLLPDAVRAAIESLLSPREPRFADQQTLLSWRHRLDRAIDLLRLLYCDEHALARNALLAVGEAKSATSASAGAIAHIDHLRHAFTSPPTRVQRKQAHPETSPLLGALLDAQNAVKEIKTFTTSRGLVAVECDDFKTLIEIGHNPYGQGSCQNYASASEYNRALLAYAADAMIKTIVIRTVGTSGNSSETLLARAIVRLGRNEETKEPVLVLERTYAAGRETRIYDPLIRKAVHEFAARRGWSAVVPDKDAVTEGCMVWIPASQNGVQYEDGSHAMVSPQGAMPRTDYVLQTRPLC